MRYAKICAHIFTSKSRDAIASRRQIHKIRRMSIRTLPVLFLEFLIINHNSSNFVQLWYNTYHITHKELNESESFIFILETNMKDTKTSTFSRLFNPRISDYKYLRNQNSNKNCNFIVLLDINTRF